MHFGPQAERRIRSLVHVLYSRGWALATVTEQLLMGCTNAAQHRGVVTAVCTSSTLEKIFFFYVQIMIKHNMIPQFKTPAYAALIFDLHGGL